MALSLALLRQQYPTVVHCSLLATDLYIVYIVYLVGYAGIVFAALGTRQHTALTNATNTRYEYVQVCIYDAMHSNSIRITMLLLL